MVTRVNQKSLFSLCLQMNLATLGFTLSIHQVLAMHQEGEGEKIISCRDLAEAVKKSIDSLSAKDLHLENATQVTSCRIKESSLRGLCIGVEQQGDKKNAFKWRLDYDHKKGAHINVQIGHGQDGRANINPLRKFAFTFPSNEKVVYQVCQEISSIVQGKHLLNEPEGSSLCAETKLLFAIKCIKFAYKKGCFPTCPRSEKSSQRLMQIFGVKDYRQSRNRIRELQRENHIPPSPIEELRQEFMFENAAKAARRKFIHTALNPEVPENVNPDEPLPDSSGDQDRQQEQEKVEP